ncbi:hypothetical protein HOC01_00945 [archaeon]|jgi:hypothetical protein|nr:hypothetical protein [archaeon]MBT6698591.1 hypothetical protein [archaeon]
MVWKNLAPKLTRQRLVIEATTKSIVRPKEMKIFLLELAYLCKMQVISGPFAYNAHECGYGGWVHWKTSGAHIYSYPTNKPLLTIDIYTCKPFDPQIATKFTREFFETIELVYKEVEI